MQGVCLRLGEVLGAREVLVRNGLLLRFCFFGSHVLPSSQAHPSWLHAARVVGNPKGSEPSPNCPPPEGIQEGWPLMGDRGEGWRMPPLLPETTQAGDHFPSRAS